MGVFSGFSKGAAPAKGSPKAAMGSTKVGTKSVKGAGGFGGKAVTAARPLSGRR